MGGITFLLWLIAFLRSTRKLNTIAVMLCWVAASFGCALVIFFVLQVTDSGTFFAIALITLSIANLIGAIIEMRKYPPLTWKRITGKEK